MARRKLRESAEHRPYFALGQPASPEADTGTREMAPLQPFVISGGRNTERYYFIHLAKVTPYKFTVKPEYFSDESNYTEAFPRRIKEILAGNADAKVFCVFDWETVYGNAKNLAKHKTFEQQFQAEIDSGSVVICESMPCFEYWFLLHFTNHTELLRNYPKVTNLLAPHMKGCFPAALSNVKFKKLIKSEKYLTDATWVKNLCDGGKLDGAIARAESNMQAAIAHGELEQQSYSKVYRMFKGQQVLEI